jgi:hypothetical protein
MADEATVMAPDQKPAAQDWGALSALAPISKVNQSNPDQDKLALRGLRSKGDSGSEVDDAADQLAERHGAHSTTEPAVTTLLKPQRGSKPQRGPRPKSPIAPHVEMPYEGDPVDWTGNLRADFPLYVLEQLNEFTHRRKCTQVSALLRMMSAFRDDEGNSVFHIREEELVPDRRKVSKTGRLKGGRP